MAMAKVQQAESKTWALAKEALLRVNLLPENADLAIRHTRLITDVFVIKAAETTKKIQNKYKGKISVSLLANIAVLKLIFGFENRDLVHAMLGEHEELKKTIRRKVPYIAQRADAYGLARDKFPALQALLASGRPFEDIDLFAELLAPSVVTEAHMVIAGKPVLSLYMVQLTEELLESEAFGAREPNALCLAAEHFAMLGDDKRARELIEEVIAAAPNHAGGWYQKARLLLKQAAERRREAARMQLLSEEGEALSATETNFEEMAGNEFLSANELRRQAFDASVRAFSLLPSSPEYEREALKWSQDYGTLRQLRYKILVFIVREAGERCNPYWESGELHERIEARLGRTRKIVFPPRPEYTKQGYEWVEDPEKMARLAALPLFSETTDQMLPLAYDQFKKIPGAFVQNFKIVQLSALNFLRVLAPQESYRREVQEFADELAMGYAPVAGLYFGAFPGQDDLGDRRKVLHEHLDTIMSPVMQREFVGRIFVKWHDDIEQRRKAAILSICDEEIRSLFACRDVVAAHQAACRGEADGIYRRDDGWGALTLTRLAQHAARAFGGMENSPESIRQHLADTAMRRQAEDWYENYYEEQLSNDAMGDGVVNLEAYLDPPYSA